MQKQVDRYIRDDVIRDRPLHCNQFAYQADKSTETALHKVAKRKDSKAQKETARGTFFNFKAAFD
jgi:hypothetical protein